MGQFQLVTTGGELDCFLIRAELQPAAESGSGKTC